MEEWMEEPEAALSNFQASADKSFRVQWMWPTKLGEPDGLPSAIPLDISSTYTNTYSKINMQNTFQTEIPYQITNQEYSSKQVPYYLYN